MNPKNFNIDIQQAFFNDLSDYSDKIQHIEGEVPLINVGNITLPIDYQYMTMYELKFLMDYVLNVSEQLYKITDK